ncbi:MAG TPA: hypothetical protein VHY20_04320, partial [Pirellulales bacterium]|nr:hypothetical protein [Pirellulales bacterium]
MGSLYGGFTQQLPAVVEAAGIPNLVVLTAAGPGETGWASSSLSGSAFGQYFQQGLAGAADDEGDADHWVSLRELHAYLARHVDQWARQNRGESQQPRLIPSTANDFHVVWALDKRARRAIQPAVADTNSRLSTATDKAIAQLWQTHDDLRARQIVRYEPVRWREFEQKLLWLEHKALGGRAYENTLGTTHAELQALGRELAQRTVARTMPVKVHSLAEAVYFDQLSPTDAGKIRADLARFLEAPNPVNLSAAITRTLPPRNLAPLAERHFLQLLGRNVRPEVVEQAELLGEALKVEELALRTRLPADERAQYWVRAAATASDQIRRRATDQLLISSQIALGKARPDLAAAHQGYEQNLEMSQQLIEAFALRDRAWNELPYLAEWLARPATLGESTAEADRLTNELLLPLIADVRKLADALAAPPAVDQGPGSVSALLGQCMEVKNRLTQVEHMFDATCQQLSSRREPTPQTWRQIDAALAVPLVSGSTREQLRKLQNSWDGQMPAGPTDRDSAQDATTDPGMTRATDELKRVATSWNIHPALALIGSQVIAEKADPAASARPSGRDSAGPDELVLRLAAQGSLLRKHLGTIPDQVRELLRADSSGAGAPTAEGQVAVVFPRAATKADHLTRTGLGLGCAAPLKDPASTLRQEDLQQLLLASAQSALDDFWGPTSKRELPYFAVAAADYVDSALAIGELTTDAKLETERLRRSIESRSRAAHEGLRPLAADILLIEQDDEVRTAIEVQPGPSAATLGLPTGEAAVFIRDARGRLPGADGSLAIAPGWGQAA